MDKVVAALLCVLLLKTACGRPVLEMACSLPCLSNFFNSPSSSTYQTKSPGAFIKFQTRPESPGFLFKNTRKSATPTKRLFNLRRNWQDTEEQFEEPFITPELPYETYDQQKPQYEPSNIHPESYQPSYTLPEPYDSPSSYNSQITPYPYQCTPCMQVAPYPQQSTPCGYQNNPHTMQVAPYPAQTTACGCQNNPYSSQMTTYTSPMNPYASQVTHYSSVPSSSYYSNCGCCCR